MVTNSGNADAGNNSQTDEKFKGAGNNGYFPRRYLTDMFKFIKANSSDIQVITYKDLEWSKDYNHENNYLNEFEAWREALRSGRFDRRKAHVLIQYDVDSQPQLTTDLLAADEHRDVPANIMIFNQRIDRRRLKTTGELGFTEYPLDDDYLRQLERDGFLIGYHSNAMEQGLFDIGKAHECFDADMHALRKRFDIQFFSAHGGVTGANELRNRDLPFHPEWQSKIRWVHNGHTVRFTKNFSDGGHNNKRNHPKDRDIRDFVRRFRPGGRYRILVHPQYYSDHPNFSASYGGTKWYDEMFAASTDPATNSLWDGVALEGEEAKTSFKQRLRSLARAILRR